MSGLKRGRSEPEPARGHTVGTEPGGVLVAAGRLGDWVQPYIARAATVSGKRLALEQLQQRGARAELRAFLAQAMQVPMPHVAAIRERMREQDQALGVP
jgi:hypothetical protein